MMRMSSAAPRVSAATVADLLAIPAAQRFHEVVDGELQRKALPNLRHGMAQMGLGDAIAGPYGPRARDRGPGGWVFASETEIAFDSSQVYRPDVAGWRRERMLTLPDDVPLRIVPDWVCEILSPSNAQNDLVRKMRTYHRCDVQHYWVLDPDAETLAVYRHTPSGYLIAQTAAGEERIRAEPFVDVELSIRGLFEAETSDASP